MFREFGETSERPQTIGW